MPNKYQGNVKKISSFFSADKTPVSALSPLLDIAVTMVIRPGDKTRYFFTAAETATEALFIWIIRWLWSI